MSYDKEYYGTINYTDYLGRKNKYFKTAEELVDLLKKLSLVKEDSEILDYGCAVGFLIEGFSRIGLNASGYDVSHWAVKESIKSGNKMVHDYTDFTGDILVSLDVFEHMRDTDIKHVLDATSPEVLIVRIPSSMDGGETFHLDVSKKDPTHINCKDKGDWLKFFGKSGYTFNLALNLFSIYDSEGVVCLLLLKDK